jgi:hypothetical protein
MEIGWTFEAGETVAIRADGYKIRTIKFNDNNTMSRVMNRIRGTSILCTVKNYTFVL